MVALDLDSGKVVGNWTGSFVDIAVRRNGLLAVLAGGKLALYETTDLQKPLWTRAYIDKQKPAILGISDGSIFISPALTSQDIEVIDLLGTGKANF